MKTIHQEALAYCQNNDWDSAHRLIQEYSDELSCRIHGYLHRIEGDLSNAGYWYHRAGLSIPNNTVTEEFALLQKMAKPEN